MPGPAQLAGVMPGASDDQGLAARGDPVGARVVETAVGDRDGGLVGWEVGFRVDGLRVGASDEASDGCSVAGDVEGTVDGADVFGGTVGVTKAGLVRGLVGGGTVVRSAEPHSPDSES